MSTYYNYQNGVRTYTGQTAGLFSRASLNLGVIGALVGGAAAAAKAIPEVKGSRMSGGQATREVLKEAAGSGLSTAAGAAMAGALGLGGALSLVAMFGVATGVKYLWNSAIDSSSRTLAATDQAEAAEAPKAAKPKKTAKK